MRGAEDPFAHRAARYALVIMAGWTEPAESAVHFSWAREPRTAVAPYATGGVSDIMGRVLAQKMSETLGQPMVVENRAGAGGMIGTAYVAKMPISRAWLLLSGVSAFVLLAIERECARRVFARLRCNGRLMRNVVIVGTNLEAYELAEMLTEDPTLGYRVVGFVTDDCRKTYETLVAKGVEITQEPTEHFYGIDIGIRDPFGNHIRIVQPAQVPQQAPEPASRA